MNIGPPLKPNLFFYEWILINSIILELWKFIHLKKKLKMEVLKVKFEIWDFKIIWRWHLKRIKFGNWNSWKFIWEWYFKK